MVVVESDWMWIQNSPNRIGCRVKKNIVRTPLVHSSLQTRLAEPEPQS